MAKRSDAEVVAQIAMFGSAAMIAQQVGGKTVRDAMFLSNFEVTSLPVMLSVAALFSIGFVLLTARAMTRLSPARVIPKVFAASAVVQIAIWGLSFDSPKVAAVAIYLHIAAVGSILVSGFWSMYNERLDPRQAKMYIARVAGGGTLGGLLGGVLAFYVSMTAILPCLALMHLCCAWLLRRLKPRSPAVAHPPSAGALRRKKSPSGLQILRRVPYLRNLALLVMLGSLATALIDYVFKYQAATAFTKSEDLMRFFATFYVAVGLLTFLIHTAVSRKALDRFGLANTVAAQPLLAALGALAGLFAPGLLTLGFARGSEAVMRNSLFRSGYELFFTPIAERDKRPTKSIIDVGFERIGDALGGGVAWLALLLLVPALAHSVMLGLAVVLAVVGLVLTRVLHTGYVATLEQSLVERAVKLDMSIVSDKTTRNALLHTMTSFNLGRHISSGAFAGEALAEAIRAKPPSLSQQENVPRTEPPDPLLRALQELRSADTARILAILECQSHLDPLLAAHVIPLLASDQVYDQAIAALQDIAPQVTGQLIDVLLGEKEAFPIRRRIPRVLVVCDTQRAADGLLAALRDRKFEVRLQSGRALDRIHERNPNLLISTDLVYDTVLREIAVDRRIWESQKLLDQSEEQGNAPMVDDFIRTRGNRRLEHVFTVLSLTLPREPLKIAFKGLHTDDDKLRGTALEYLESLLPVAIREKLWPFLEDTGRRPKAPDRSRDEILKDLLQSHQSIELSLENLRRRIGD